MKRALLYCLLFVAIVGMFGGFLSQSKAFAAFDRSRFDIIVANAIVSSQVDDFIPADIDLLKNREIKQFLRDSAESIYLNRSNDTDMTETKMSFLVLNKIASDFQAYMAKPGNSTQETFSIRNSLESSRQRWTIRLNEEQGKTTAAAASAAIGQNVSNQQASIANASRDFKVQEAKKAETLKECGFFGDKSSVIACVDQGIAWLIKVTLLQIAGFLVWLTSNMFSYAMQMGVLNFKDWAPDALYGAWVLVRQTISLIIVFVGLYLGFMYILGREDKFEKFFPWVMVFALFVNFSYPLARTAIDISNVITLNVYTAAFSNSSLSGVAETSAGAIIMNKLGLGDLVMGATYVEGNPGTGIIKNINSVPAALLTVCFVLYAAYVFFIATAIIAIRTLALVLLTIASPLLFVDSVLPILGEKAKLVRKIFVEQLTVGPVFVLLLALTTRLLQIFSDPVTGAIKSNASNLQATNNGVIVFFNVFMMLALLHITMKITKNVSGAIGQYAADAMGKVGGFATGAAVGAATGGAGLLARGTLGKLASQARDSSWVRNNQDSFIGRRAYDMSHALAKSSYDLRNSSVIAGGLSKAGVNMGAVGKGRKTGYEEDAEARRKAVLERASRIKTRYERDEVDKEGNIIHRKGDINEEGEKALDRYNANAGGAVFMAKDQKEKAREALGDAALKESEKRAAEAEKDSKGDIDLYNKAKTKEEKGALVEQLKKDLEKVKETDSELRGQQAQTLLRSLKEITEKDKKEAEDFTKQVTSHIKNYNNLSGEEQKKYLTRLSDEMQEAVKSSANSFNLAKPDFETDDSSLKFEDSQIPNSGGKVTDLPVFSNKNLPGESGSTNEKPVVATSSQSSALARARQRLADKNAAATV